MYYPLEAEDPQPSPKRSSNNLCIKILGCCITACGIILLIAMAFTVIYLIQPVFNAFSEAVNRSNIAHIILRPYVLLPAYNASQDDDDDDYDVTDDYEFYIDGPER